MEERIKGFCKSLGADLVGIASSNRFEEAPKGHRPDDLLEGANSVIVVGIRILEPIARWEGRLSRSEIFPEIERKPVPRQTTEELYYPRRAIEAHIYGRYGYDALNIELERISYRLAIFLEDNGYKALPLPSTYGSGWTANPPKIAPWFAPFSHRHAAVLAGLGELGLNNLVITPEFGPRVRLCSIITTAKLQPDPLLDKSLCLGEKCGKCISACPHNVFGEIYEFKMAGKSMKLAKVNKEKCWSRVDACGRCLSVCPLPSV